jgi:hypothetical protein
MSSRRRRKVLYEDSLEAEILGWTETHEQANNVARQAQRISHIDRWSAGHMQSGKFKTVELLLDSARRLVRGAACVSNFWRKKTRAKTRSMTGKITSNPEHRIAFITCQMWQPAEHASARLCLIGICQKKVQNKNIVQWTADVPGVESR